MKPLKIHVVGGGPAGLYMSALVKKVNPRADISLWERDAPEDTFGWGVVFSDETLGNLEEADAESYREITSNFAYWDRIDVHVHGRTIRSGGHGFCGIARPRLLQIMRDRAQALGVETHFHTPVDDIEALRDCDLLVAADGLHSAIRTRYESAFQPSFDVGKSWFIWLGSRQQLEAFTFSFKENEHGVFQIHAYQFEPETSTFIVECDEPTLRAAGLDEASEEQSIRYCEELFADELGGHGLMANRSFWTRFTRVQNERWHHDNIVLAGDAAHTAHFSVGSGTKMAMEDGIELAAAFAKHDDLADALREYEEQRKPMVGRTQKAAIQSREWFEQSRRHLRQPAERVAFDLLTRTRRITHDNLKLRDPGYIEQVDRWFMKEQGLDGAGDADAPIVPPLLTPFELRGMRLQNRAVVSPMCQYSAEDGTPNDWHMVHLGSRAIGGAGLVYTEMTDVSREGRISPGCTGMYKDEHVGAWARIVDFVHAHSCAKIALQIAHAGRKASTCRPWEGGGDEPLPDGNWPIIGPSPIPWTGRNQIPREMTRQDMAEVRDSFVRAAEMGERAGFDMLEIHFAHGYLLSSFLTPVSNQREDEYGGSLEGRARYPLEVLDAVRQVWPDKPLSVRISATDWVPDGFDVEDAVVLAGWLAERGVDIVDVSAGQTSPDQEPVYGRAFQMPFSERIRNDVGIPTMTVGNIWTHDQVNTILVAGRADLVALARAHLADPYWTMHAALSQGYPRGYTWPDQYRQAAVIAERLFEPDPGAAPETGGRGDGRDR